MLSGLYSFINDSAIGHLTISHCLPSDGKFVDISWSALHDMIYRCDIECVTDQSPA